MKKGIFCLLLFVPIILVLTDSHAQDKSLKKIRWGVTSLSASQWIPWIAKEAKIYEKHGLDTELILLRGSGQSSQAIIGGSIFAAPVHSGHCDQRRPERRGPRNRGPYCSRCSEQVAG